MGYVLFRRSRKVRALRAGFLADHPSHSVFERVLLESKPSDWKLKLRFVYPYALAIIAIGAMLHQFYKPESKSTWEFLAYEKRFINGAVAYEPWFSLAYLAGIGFLCWLSLIHI